MFPEGQLYAATRKSTPNNPNANSAAKSLQNRHLCLSNCTRDFSSLIFVLSDSIELPIDFFKKCFVELAIGSNQIEVRHAPGHTPGHVMFYCENAKVLFSGDVIFKGSIGRTDLPGGNYDTLMQAILEQVLTLPDDVRILSGHMGETTVGAERRTNPFLLHG